MFFLGSQMIVIGHLAPGVDGPVVALAALGQGFQPGFAVNVVDKDILAPIPPRGHVVETAREFEPQGTGHARSLDQVDAIFQDLTPTCLAHPDQDLLTPWHFIEESAYHGSWATGS